METQTGPAPEPAHLPVADAEEPGHLLLWPAVIEGQAEHLAQFRRQTFDRLVQGLPALQVARVGGVGVDDLDIDPNAVNGYLHPTPRPGGQ